MAARRSPPAAGQLALFGAAEPDRRVRRLPPRHTAEELAAFDRLNGVLAAIRPEELEPDVRLCPGECGKGDRAAVSDVRAALV